VPTLQYDGNVCFDPRANALSGAVTSPASYYRPNGSKGFFFYNGKVQTCVDVMFPSGKKKRVVAIN